MKRRKFISQAILCGLLPIPLSSPSGLIVTRQRSILCKPEGIPSGWLKIIGPFGPCWYNPEFLKPNEGGNGLLCLQGNMDYSPHMKLVFKLPPLERLAT